MKKKPGLQVPDDLAAAFASNPKADAVFRALSASHQQEYVQWIEQAKNSQTRQRRIAKATEMVLAKH